MSEDNDEYKKIKKTFIFAVRKNAERVSKTNDHMMNLLDLCEEMAIYTQHKPGCAKQPCNCGLNNVLKQYDLLNVIKHKEDDNG